MVRSLAILITALMLAGISAASDTGDSSAVAQAASHVFAIDQSVRSPEFLESLGIEGPTAVVKQQACCKICRAGKACGDTCIARDKVCHVGPGCACDG